MKKEKDQLHNSNFIDACHNAINGIIYATTTQSNIKKQLIIAVLVMILSLFYNLEKAEFICLVFAVIAVIFAEMVNTAVETLVDMYTQEYHPKAKIAKDVAAGGVVIVAFGAVIVAYFLFFKDIAYIGTNVLQQIQNSPMHIVFVIMVVTIIAVIAVKAVADVRQKKKSLKKAFSPSGQAALAFAALTAIWLYTSDVVTFTLSLILAVLIVMNRRNDTRTTGEVIFGSCMGILIAFLICGIAFMSH